MFEAAVAAVASATIFLFSATLVASSFCWLATTLAASALALSFKALTSHAALLSFSSGSGAFFSAASRSLTALPCEAA